MATISLRISDEEYNLIQEYVSVNSMNMSSFVRETVIDRIEQELNLDEERILAARERAKYEKVYDHAKVWDELGV